MGEVQKRLSQFSSGRPRTKKIDSEYEFANRKWLGYSTNIALRVLAAIESFPQLNQEKLAEIVKVRPQQISKIVKGRENMTLQTIAKLSEALNQELISFPDYKYQEVKYSKPDMVVNGKPEHPSGFETASNKVKPSAVEAAIGAAVAENNKATLEATAA